VNIADAVDKRFVERRESRFRRISNGCCSRGLVASFPVIDPGAYP
jgi:hypothetical protein